MVIPPRGEKTFGYLPFLSFAAAVLIAVIAGPSLRVQARRVGEPTHPSENFQIKVTHVVFNHDWTNHKDGPPSLDALSMRVNFDTELEHGPIGKPVAETGAGEWIVMKENDKRAKRNEPALYLR